VTARLLRALAMAAVAAGLTGCVSVFPKSEPAQLYSFGRNWSTSEASAAAAPANRERAGLLLAAVDFPRAAQGDAILTMTGAEAAYITETRWVAPAVVLFREAVERRFDDTGQRTRLVARGDIGKTSLILRLDVREFEAVYPYAEAVPSVTVSARARLVRADGTAVDERTFTSTRPAAENRVSSIVQGLDASAMTVVDEIVAWTEAAAAALPQASAAAR
jgi:cholesterol transport system auxiliary component